MTVLERVGTDLRYAARTMVAGRLFSAVAVTCLALAISTSTTVFSVFDAIFLRPLPFTDAAALVSISGRHPQTGRRVALSFEDLRDLRLSVQSLAAMAELVSPPARGSFHCCGALTWGW